MERSHVVCTSSLHQFLLTVQQETLATVRTKMEGDMSVLEEQKRSLQVTMNEMSASIQRQDAAFALMKDEYNDRLNQQAEALKYGQDCLKQLTDDRNEAQARCTAAENQIKSLEDESRDLRVQLQAAHLPSPETEAELRTLRSQIATLESEQLRSTLRARTIDSRYRSGDLVCATPPCQTPCSLVAARTRKRSHSYIISCRHRKLSMNRTRPLIATSFDECVGFHPTSTLVNRSTA